jgi:MoaA/NifB/PqqE/SkfB family radical SAM enzyme
MIEQLAADAHGRIAACADLGVPRIHFGLGTGELLAGREQAWDRAVASVRLLTGLRDAGWPLFVIVNTVISERNRMDADNIVDFLLSLGIDDMKLITVVQRKEDLGNFPEAERVVDGVRRALARYPEASLPLLRRKLQTVFSPDAIGLDAVPPDPAWRCYIPLTERTVDSLHYYPCSVYRREGGAPLGSVVEPQRVQMAKSIDFVLNGDCTSDPICRRYCLHCTRTFNVNANILARSPRADGRPPSTSI